MADSSIGDQFVKDIGDSLTLGPQRRAVRKAIDDKEAQVKTAVANTKSKAKDLYDRADKKLTEVEDKVLTGKRPAQKKRPAYKR